MAVRFSSEFYNINNEIWAVYIEDSDYVGSEVVVQTMSDGFTLSWSDDQYIKGSKAQVSILVDDTISSDIDSFLSDLLTAEESRFTIRITWKSNPAAGAQQYWVGYVLPDLSGYDDLVTYVFRITATDGLGRLKGIEYKDDSGPKDAPFGYLTVNEHIRACLNEDALSALYWDATTDVFLRTVVNWQDSAVGAPVAAVCPTTRIQINGENFAELDESEDGDGWEFMSCYDVLLEICRHFDARLFLSQGAYRFEQFNERSDDIFYERTFSSNGTLIGSSASAGYDKTIDQGAGGFKIATIQFAYKPALKRVTVNYKHGTYRNYLAGLWYKWYKNSTNNTTHDILSIGVDTDTRIKLTGNLKLNITNPLFTGPWRYIFTVYIRTSGGYQLQSNTQAVVSGNGIPQNVTTRETPDWTLTGQTYEVTTQFISAPSYVGTIPINILTPVVPGGTTSLEIDFYTFRAENNTNGVIASVVNDWAVTDLIMLLVNSDDAANFESDRRYQLTNPVAGNSETLTIETLFGHAVKPWAPRKLLTSSDGSTWTDTTATWEADNAGTSFEFGELLAAEVMSARRIPKKLMQGSVSGLAIHAHSRLVTPDTLGWLMVYASLDARTGTWTGEWMNAGIDRLTSGPVIRKKPYHANELIALPSTPGAISTEGIFNPVIGAGNLALSAITTNYLLDSLPSKNVSSLDLQYPVAANTYLAGDVVLLVDPYNFLTDALIVAADAAEGDTTLSIVPQVVSHDYTAGSNIIYAPLNKTTTQGGGGSAGGVRKVEYKEFAAIGGTKAISGKIMSAYFAADSAGLARTISIGTTSGGYEICQDEPINNGSRWTLAYTEFFDSPTFYITCDSAVSMYFGYDTL